MNLFTNHWDVVSPVLVWLLGLPIIFRIGRKIGQGQKRSLFLYSWHTVWCIVYLFYSLIYSADSLGYYTKAASGQVDFELGTSAVSFLTALFVQFLGLSYLSCFLAYNIIGAIGYLMFDRVMRDLVACNTPTIKRMTSLIILLPSVSFWSSAIGKDSIAFTASCLALWSVLCIERRVVPLVLSIVLMFLVRPHVAFILVLAIAVQIILRKETSLLLRASLLSLMLCFALFVSPIVLNYIGLSDLQKFGEVSSFVEQRQQYNQEGGGAIDISQLSLPSQMISYLLRPFIFEANSLTLLASSMDNLLLTCIFASGILGWLKGNRSYSSSLYPFLIAYSLICLVIFASTTSNLGIAMRQKWMFLPMTLYLSLSIAGKSEHFSSNLLSSGTSSAILLPTASRARF